MRLLVVEDEPALAGLLRSGLARGGFALDVASGIADAQAHLRVADYDAIILISGWRTATG